MRFLQKRSLWSFSLYMSHLWLLRQIVRLHNLLLKAMQETKTSLASCVGVRNCFCLRKSRPASWAESKLESKTEVLLVFKEVQKQVCHLAVIFYRKVSEKWPPTMWLWRSSAKDKTFLCQRPTLMRLRILRWKSASVSVKTELMVDPNNTTITVI